MNVFSTISLNMYISMQMHLNSIAAQDLQLDLNVILFILSNRERNILNMAIRKHPPTTPRSYSNMAWPAGCSLWKNIFPCFGPLFTIRWYFSHSRLLFENVFREDTSGMWLLRGCKCGQKKKKRCDIYQQKDGMRLPILNVYHWSQNAFMNQYFISWNFLN